MAARLTDTPATAGPAGRAALDAPRVRASEFLLVLAAALLVYAVTLAPGMLWQDYGLAQYRTVAGDFVGARGLALSHPLYYLVTTAFQGVPIGQPPLRVNLVSALFGALSVANVYLLLRRLTPAISAEGGAGRLPAALGAVSLGVAHTFWKHSVMAETRTLYTAMLTTELLLLHLCLQAAASAAAPRGFAGAGRWVVLLLLVNGLSVSNHLLALLDLAVLGLVVLWMAARRQVAIGAVLAGAAAWLAGASIYLWLVVGEWLSGTPLPEVVHSALFGNYARNVLNTQVTFRLLLESVFYLGLNFPTPTVLLAVAGLAGLRRFTPRPMAAALGGLLAIHLLWAVRYDIVDRFTYFIPTIVLLSLLIGLGAAAWLPGRRRIWRRLALAACLLPVVLYAALPAAITGLGMREKVPIRTVPYRDELRYFFWPWKTGYRGAEQLAAEVHRVVPDRAYVLADSTSAWAMHYARRSGEWTRQIEVWPPPNWEKGGRTERTYEHLAPWLEAGTLYAIAPQPAYCPQWLLDGYEFEPAGAIFRVAGPKLSPDADAES